MKPGFLFFLSSAFMTFTSTLSMACTPYSDLEYQVQANGATGTLIKNQVCEKNTYSISSQLNVKKGFFSKAINQSAKGYYPAHGHIMTESYISSNSNTTFPKGDMDPLSLVLYLSDSLERNTPFSPISLFYNNQSILMSCSINNQKASLLVSENNTLPATEIICSNTEATILLNYTFSQDGLFTLLSTNIEENGKNIFSTLIHQK